MYRSPRAPASTSPKHHRKRRRRGFKEIPLRVIGFQWGPNRFPGASGYEDADTPRVNAFRNNLVAHSLRYNLYFVACDEVVHVYRPEFPSQQLSQLPALRLRWPATGLRPPMFSDTHPSSVNNMLVSDLGDDEILVMACNDGGIVAFYTRHVRDTITRQEFDNQLEVGPFFFNYVDNSAWGLAVHSKGRIIAVSCNDYEIDIFAFGLNSGKSGLPEVEAEDVEMNDEASYEGSDEATFDEHGWKCFSRDDKSEWQAAFAARDQDIRLCLSLTHQSNIPCVGMCNTDEDLAGRYLNSTDIAGRICIWDLSVPCLIKSIAPDTIPDPTDSPYDPLRAGWCSGWIDHRSFSQGHTPQQCWGGLENLVESRIANPFVVETTATREHVIDGGPRVLNTSAWSEGSRQDGIVNMAALPRPDTSSVAEPDHMDMHPLVQSPLSSSILRSLGEDQDILEGILYASDTEETADEAASDGRHHDLDDLFMDGFDLDSFMDDSHHRFICPMFGLKPSVEEGMAFAASGKFPRHSPFLHVMPRAVHIMQSVNFGTDTPREEPVFFMDNPLKHDSVIWMAQNIWTSLDRMNLFVQISELGVILLGNGKGRVAVFTLHRLDNNPWAPGSLKSIYSMRLDWILPLHRQECARQRPMQPLVGLTAAPMQGYEKHSRRPWRVFLHYRCHTVLSYQLGGDV